MDLISAIILGIGLAMDAFAVSICSSFAVAEIKFRQTLKMAFFFGIFQAGMPVIGWLAGTTFRDLIQGIDHWIAFGLLAIIGGKMIVESIRMHCETPRNNPFKLHVLLGLAVATSIDALAAGISFSILRMNLLTIVSIIGVITFVLSIVGTRIGKMVGCRFSNKVELTGGIILLGIGIKIVIQHIFEGI